MYAFIGIVIVFAICLIFLIFAPNKRNFLQYKDYYPDLKQICENKTYKQLILQEIDDTDWEESNELRIIPILSNGMWKHQHKYPQLSNLVHIADIQSLTIAKIEPNTVLKPRTFKDPDNIRISTSLDVPSSSLNKCGVWTKGDMRPLDSTVMYDANNLHSMFNSRKTPAIILIIDMIRPKKI